ncbi:hypothetical protein H696_02464 [Fonticula alba]|uniref:Presequence protease, mitochondrial n=1 Tax=Fonticula alba TaxID=691883 RepID=A0A058ZDJ3_FONAL|nr:hypothetical protein H696_02464 [Fonticula alba]KCV71527.1 hypothetical protein H696_02464 [Fonticula alba]|eukprot:XP_009494650.1 hypothetical protein H696_02464 [Fonticula alba]
MFKAASRLASSGGLAAAQLGRSAAFRPALSATRAFSETAAKMAAVMAEPAIAVDQPEPVERVATLTPGAHLLNGAFRVEGAVRLPAFDAAAVHLRHVATGAEHVHIARDDPNNSFSVAFKTPPYDSSGTPHILEHVTLCGSAKYPVRDPFMKMLTRSVANFINAMTDNDLTMYPFSTHNPQDYRNLMSVYLDSTFFPRLALDDFRQEGWRLEHATVEDEKSPIVFKGVVFNEMKGVMSDVSTLFQQHLSSQLFLGTPYEFNSGGEPAVIPELTHEQLVDFHKKCYQPSNARFYTYGALPLEGILQQIQTEVFDRVPADYVPSTANPATRNEFVDPATASPRTVEVGYPSDSDSSGHYVSVAFVTNPIEDCYASFEMRVLSDLLTSGPTSPMYKALIESDIGSDFAPGVGVSSQQRETAIAIGVRGVETRAECDKVEGIIFDTLRDVCKTGFPAERIEAVMHQMELSLKHQSTEFGLNLGLGLNNPWIHGASPLTVLQFENYGDRPRAALQEDPDHLLKLLRKQLLENNRRVTLVMSPDVGMKQRQAEAEMELLQGRLLQLSASDKGRIFEEGLKLKKLQESEQDISILPNIQLEDMPSRNTFYGFDGPADTQARVPVFTTHQPTNGVVYLNTIQTLSSETFLKSKPAASSRALLAPFKKADPATELHKSLDRTGLVPYLPIYAQALTFMSTEKRSYGQVSDDIDLYTGGLSFNPFLRNHPAKRNVFEFGLASSTFALSRNVPQMMDLKVDTGLQTDFSDRQRLRHLVEQLASDTDEQLSRSGHSIAANAAASLLDDVSFGMYAAMGGCDQLALLDVLSQPSADMDRLAETLLQIDRLVKADAGVTADGSNTPLGAKSMRALLTASPETMPAALDAVAPALGRFATTTTGVFRNVVAPSGAATLPPALTRAETDHYLKTAAGQPGRRNVFLAHPLPINHCARVFQTRQFLAPASAADVAALEQLDPHTSGPLPVDLFGGAHLPVRQSVALSLACQMLSRQFLHREIREKGGAYGSGAYFDSSRGLLVMTSYFDPHVVETLNVFDQAHDWLLNTGPDAGWDESDLRAAKLALLGSLDSPQSPSARAVDLFRGAGLVSEAIQQEMRQAIFDLSAEELRDVYRQYVANAGADSVATAVLGDRQNAQHLAAGTPGAQRHGTFDVRQVLPSRA